MPLSQRDQYANRKGLGLVRFGAVLCLAAFLFGSICMTIVATIGHGEDPPKIFQQMGGASCVVFAVGLIVALVGWVISLSATEPPKPAARKLQQDNKPLDPTDDETTASSTQADKAKPDPYASDHRRRGF